MFFTYQIHLCKCFYFHFILQRPTKECIKHSSGHWSFDFFDSLAFVVVAVAVAVAVVVVLVAVVVVLVAVVVVLVAVVVVLVAVVVLLLLPCCCCRVVFVVVVLLLPVLVLPPLSFFLLLLSCCVILLLLLLLFRCCFCFFVAVLLFCCGSLLLVSCCLPFCCPIVTNNDCVIKHTKAYNNQSDCTFVFLQRFSCFLIYFAVCFFSLFFTSQCFCFTVLFNSVYNGQFFITIHMPFCILCLLFSFVVSSMPLIVSKEHYRINISENKIIGKLKN